jgi:hypothetical protein
MVAASADRAAALDRLRRQPTHVIGTLTEKQWLAQVVDLAKLFGWATYHPWLSIHSPRGWPDLALVRPPRLVLVELKTDKGRTSPAQDAWLELLRQVPGVEVFVWRPADIEQVAGVLR